MIQSSSWSWLGEEQMVCIIHHYYCDNDTRVIFNHHHHTKLSSVSPSHNNNDDETIIARHRRYTGDKKTSSPLPLVIYQVPADHRRSSVHQVERTESQGRLEGLGGNVSRSSTPSERSLPQELLAPVCQERSSRRRGLAQRVG